MKIKSLLIIVCLFLIINYIKGQDTLTLNAHKLSTELNFNPFDGSLTLNNTNAQIKIRKFVTDKRAIRIAINTSYMQYNNNKNSAYGSTIDINSHKKSFLTAINFGVEKHLSGSRRISPYWGWEVGVGLKLSKESTKDGARTRSIKGAWIESEPNYPNYRTTFGQRGFWSVGGNFILGFDFFMSQNFYFGYEMSFGIDYYKYSNIDVTLNYDGGETFPKYNDDSWTLGPKLVNGFRVGFMF